MIELIRVKLDVFLVFMNSGGLAMWVLFVLNLFLWYGLGQRRMILRRGSYHEVRRLVEKQEAARGRTPRGMLDQAIIDGLRAAAEAGRRGLAPRNFVVDALSPYFTRIRKHSILIKTIVVIAPLIGLLGTVSGMIETFDALKTSAMFAQGASISGGISKALFTTELGLVVAVPGLIIGRVLDRQAGRFALEFDQLTDIICTKEIPYEV